MQREDGNMRFLLSNGATVDDPDLYGPEDFYTTCSTEELSELASGPGVVARVAAQELAARACAHATEASKYSSVRAVVAEDAEASAHKWSQAIEDGAQWRAEAKECSAAYDAALEALDDGDLARAEMHLERALAEEVEGGDCGDADHALRAVRALAHENA